MNYEQGTRMTPYVQKIQLNSNKKNERRSRRKPPKPCADCKHTSNNVKFLSSKINRIEELVHDISKILPKKTEFSIYNAKFTLNNVPCELECDLTSFTLEEIQSLVNFTTRNFNNPPSNRNGNPRGKSSDQ